MFLSSVKHFSHYAFSCTLFKDNYAASLAEVHSFILAALHQQESCLEIKGCVRLQTKELIFVYYNTQLPSNFFSFFFFLFLVLIPVSGCLNYSGRLTFLLSAERQATCAGALQVPGLTVLEILTSFITVFSWEMELAGFSFFNLKRQMCKFQ